MNKKGETKINQYRSQLRVCEDRSALLRDHFGEDPKCDVVHLFDVLDKFIGVEEYEGTIRSGVIVKILLDITCTAVHRYISN